MSVVVVDGRYGPPYLHSRASPPRVTVITGREGQSLQEPDLFYELPLPDEGRVVVAGPAKTHVTFKNRRVVVAGRGRVVEPILVTAPVFTRLFLNGLRTRPVL